MNTALMPPPQFGFMVDLPPAGERKTCPMFQVQHLIYVMPKGLHYNGKPIAQNAFKTVVARDTVAPGSFAFVLADPTAEVGAVIETIDELKATNPDINIALLTPQMLQRGCLLVDPKLLR